MRATFLFYSQIDSYREMLVRFRSHKILIHLIHPRTTRIIIVRCSYFSNKRLRVISNVRNHPRRGCWSRKWIHMWLTSVTINYVFVFFLLIFIFFWQSFSKIYLFFNLELGILCIWNFHVVNPYFYFSWVKRISLQFTNGFLTRCARWIAKIKL